MSVEPASTGSGSGSPRLARVYLALVGFAVLVVVVAASSLPFIDPDEVFYAGIAREMVEHHSFLTPILFSEPNFEKPPLTYWLIIASFKLFGEHELAARLVPALFGLLGAVMTYLFARRVLPSATAALAALLLASGALYLGLSVGLLTDMVFSVLVAASLLAFHRWYSDRRSVYLHLHAVLLALGVLTKGPVGLVVALLAIVLFLVLTREPGALRSYLLHPWWVTFLAVALPWYLYATWVHGRAFTMEFLVHDNWDRILEAEHHNLDRFSFYPAVMVLGIFPWTPLLAFLGAPFRRHRSLLLFLGCWIGATWLPFAIAASKLPSYILPLFPALALALAVSLENAPERRVRCVVAGVVSALLGAGLLALPFLVASATAGDWRPLVLVGTALGAVQVLVGVLLIGRRVTAAILLNAAGFLIAVLVGCLALPASAGLGHSDADLAPIVAAQGLDGQPVLAAKSYARGVWYYARVPVTVVDRRQQPFWTPHPIPVASQDEELRSFFAGRDKALCVIGRDDLQRLEALFAGTRTETVLSGASNRLVVLSVRNR